MCDLSGIWYMIGAILDGESTIPCNTARGSRYNSALTYISSRCNKQNIRILIAIFSEDGSIDIVYNEGNKIVKWQWSSFEFSLQVYMNLPRDAGETDQFKYLKKDGIDMKYDKMVEMTKKSS